MYLQVIQNIYSPNRVYLTSPHDNSWVFNNIVHIIKKYRYTVRYNLLKRTFSIITKKDDLTKNA